MGFIKYQKVEDAKLVEEREAQRIAAELHRLGKTSAKDLTDTERKSTLDSNSA